MKISLHVLKLQCLLIVLIGFSAFQCFAAPEDEYWTASVQLGAHSAGLDGLKKLYYAPTNGLGSIEGKDGNTFEKFTISSPLTGSSVGAKTSLTFLWSANERHSIIFGFGSWEATAFGVSTINIPIQGKLKQLFYERRAKFSYTEFSTGWRYNIYNSNKYRVYSRLAVHEMFDLDFRDDSIFTFFDRDGNVEFRRIVVMEAQTGALMTGEFGFGGEWRLSKWFSLGAEVAYLLAERPVQLRDLDVKGVGTIDSIQGGLPYGARSDRTVGYLVDFGGESVDDRYERLDIDMSGVQVMFSINVRY